MLLTNWNTDYIGILDNKYHFRDILFTMDVFMSRLRNINLYTLLNDQHHPLLFSHQSNFIAFLLFYCINHMLGIYFIYSLFHGELKFDYILISNI